MLWSEGGVSGGFWSGARYVGKLLSQAPVAVCLPPNLVWFILAAILLEGFGQNQIASAADVTVDLRTALDADTLPTTDFEGYSRRRLWQDLGLSVRNLLTVGEVGDTRELLGLVFMGRIFTDFERSVVDLPEDATDEDRAAFDPRSVDAADIDLQRLYLELSPHEAVRFRLGRQLVLGPLPTRDLDGIEGGWVRSGWIARLGLGREVRHTPLGLDGGYFDLQGARREVFGDPAPDPTWMGQLVFGYEWDGIASVTAGHRMRFRHDDRVGYVSGLTGRLDLAPFELRVATHLNHLLSSPDRIEAGVRLRLPDVTVGLWWELRRPVFDADSIFNVFDLTPSVQWLLSGEARISPSLRVSGMARLRAYDLQGEVPWSGGLLGDANETSGGGGLRLWVQPFPHWLGSFNTDLEVGYGGLSAANQVDVRWRVVPRLEVGGLGRWSYRDDARWDRSGHQLAGRLEVTYTLGSFGEVALWAERRNDFRLGRSTRLFALVSFELGPY